MKVPAPIHYTPDPFVPAENGCQPANTAQEIASLKQRVAALEDAYGGVMGKATLNATNAALAAVGASHKAPGAIVPAEPATDPLAGIPDAATRPFVRRVVCAASRPTAANPYPTFNDPHTIFISARHYDLMAVVQIRRWCYWYTSRFDQPDPETEEGFIDQRGEFMTRQEAWHVALAAGQIRYRCGGDDANGGTLYSENLY